MSEQRVGPILWVVWYNKGNGQLTFDAFTTKARAVEHHDTLWNILPLKVVDSLKKPMRYIPKEPTK